MSLSEHNFSDRETLLTALHDDCEKRLKVALESRGEATLLVSGGSTPEPLYQRLSTSPLDWTKVSIALVDERWVTPDHPASNEAFIRNTLLQRAAGVAHFTGMKTPHPSAAEGLADCEARYRALNAPFDLCLLGMGADGHTASLFPNAQGLDAAFDTNNDALCAAITAVRSAVTGEHTERCSLTLGAICRCRRIVLLFFGDAKRQIYEQALITDQPRQLPVAAVLQQTTVPVDVYYAP